MGMLAYIIQFIISLFTASWGHFLLVSNFSKDGHLFNFISFFLSVGNHFSSMIYHIIRETSHPPSSSNKAKNQLLYCPINLTWVM